VTVDPWLIAGGVLSAGILIYLLVALLVPERLS
jgi:K+-transporting ATPase KdpF subunit